MKALRDTQLLLLLLLQCVSSLPVTHTHTHTHLEHEDLKVIQCIVEVLTDALSKFHSLPVSQQCVETLRTDDRLVTVLRHHNFLQELQDVAVEGANERSAKRIGKFSDHAPDLQEPVGDHAPDLQEPVGDHGPDLQEPVGDHAPDLQEPVGDHAPDLQEPAGDHAPDLQEPADQSMLMTSQTRRKTPDKRRAKQEKKNYLQDDDIITEEEVEEKHSVMTKTENSEEEGGRGGGRGAEHRRVEEESRSQSQEESRSQEAVKKRRVRMGRQRNWSRSEEAAQRRVHDQQEALHRFKEAWTSPEEEELKTMAGREPEEHGDLAEGSATRKSEDAEMESLAVMENELENMVQKLHQLRRG